MSIQVISSSEQFFQAREPWNRLSGSNPFQSWEWCYHWYEHIESWADLNIVYDVDRSGAWKGIAPLVGCTTRLGARKIYSMGSGQACTDYMQLVCAGNHRRMFTDKIVDWIRQPSETGFYEVVEFDGVELESPQTKRLVKAMKESGFQTSVIPTEGCWKLDLKQNWESLNQSFSRKLRRKTRKAVNRLHDSSISIQLASHSDFDFIWNQFVRLHQKRRRMLGQEGCFADPGFHLFLRSASQSLIERGLCELILLSHNETPFAATLLFQDYQNAFMYQTGFDPEYCSHEPGYMLIVAAMQWAIDRKLQAFDFLRGDEPYKARWNTKRVPLAKLRFMSEESWVSKFRGFIWKENLEWRRKAGWLKTKMKQACAFEAIGARV